MSGRPTAAQVAGRADEVTAGGRRRRPQRSDGVRGRTPRRPGRRPDGGQDGFLKAGGQVVRGGPPIRAGGTGDPPRVNLAPPASRVLAWSVERRRRQYRAWAGLDRRPGARPPECPSTAVGVGRFGSVRQGSGALLPVHRGRGLLHRRRVTYGQRVEPGGHGPERRPPADTPLDRVPPAVPHPVEPERPAPPGPVPGGVAGGGRSPPTPRTGPATGGWRTAGPARVGAGAARPVHTGRPTPRGGGPRGDSFAGPV